MEIKDPKTGKKIDVCHKCGVELDWKERVTHICAVCERNLQDKEDERKRRME